jgi:hypothetical protein
MYMSEPRTHLDQRFSEPRAAAVPWDETCARIEQAQLFWITPVRADGRPHVTPLVADWHDGALHFCTGAQEHKAPNLAANPNVALTTGANEWNGGPRSRWRGSRSGTAGGPSAGQGGFTHGDGVAHDLSVRLTKGRWLSPVSARLMMAILAMVAGCASAPSSRTSAAAGQFVGFRWRIGEVQHGAKHVTIPAALHGYVAFARDHTLLADDSVNTYFGHYRAATDSFRPVQVGTTLVGYVGNDPARTSLIHAVEALTWSKVAVTAAVDGAHLRLSTAHYTIICSKLGTAPNQQTPAPTPTRS